MTRQEFDEQVQDALSHFHDRAHLQTHPLTRVLLGGPLDGREGAQLQRRLLASIEELTPRLGAHADVPEWRRARYLFLRYVERLSHEQVVAELGISPRQGHRDHHEGVASLGALLWSQRPHGVSHDDRGWPPNPTIREMVEAQAQRLASGDSHGPSDVGAALAHALATTRGLARSLRVSVRVDTRPDLPPAMIGPAVLGQATLATLSLGIATCVGPELTVEASSDGQNLRIVVSPCRLSADDQARVAVIGQLLEAQQGHVGLIEGSGAASIELVLPLARPRSVLVIDDDADFVRLLTRYLVGYHYRTLAASDVDEGLRLAREECPDLVILDVVMPSRDGWDVLRQLRTLPGMEVVPVVVCSVLADPELARSLGAVGVLPKPVTQRALLATVQAHCHGVEPARPGSRSGN